MNSTRRALAGTALLLFIGSTLAAASTAAAATSGWGKPVAVDISAESPNLPSVSCPTGSGFCVAIDGSGNYLKLSGGKWSKPVHFDPKVNGAGGGVDSVSCPTATFCAAVDYPGYGLIWNGKSWSKPHLVDGDGNGSVDINSVSCASANFCMAVDSNGAAIEYSKGAWGAAQSIDPQFQNKGELGVLGISCPSSSFCMAVDAAGYAIEYSAGAWGTPTLVDESTLQGGTAMYAISCPDAQFCMAVDGLGYALSFNGSWSSPQLVLSDNSQFSSVSCTSSTFCVAGINAANASSYIGDVVTYNGAWQTPRHVDSTGGGGSEDVVSVSCSTIHYCAAGDNQGYALVYDTRLVSKAAVASPSSVAKGKSFTVKASVRGISTGAGQPTPTGGVTVTVGKRACVANLSGSAGKATASCKFGPLTSGKYKTSVSYRGDGTFRPSSASGAVVVK